MHLRTLVFALLFALLTGTRLLAQSSSAESNVFALDTRLIAPAFGTAPLAMDLKVGTAYTTNLTATGSPTPAFAVGTGTLPPGLTLTSNTGSLSGTPSTTGIYTGTFSATNLAGSVTQAFSFTVNSSATPFTSWRTSQFTPAQLADATISGPAADPDGDGLPNLVEYALGLDPLGASRTGMPSVALNNGELSFTYTRSAASTNLTYTVQTTSTLGDPASWTTNGVSQGTPNAQGVTTATLTLGSSSGIKVYLRLQVSVTQ